MCVCDSSFGVCVCVSVSNWLGLYLDYPKRRVLWRSLVALAVKDRMCDQSICAALPCILTAWLMKPISSHKANPEHSRTKDTKDARSQTQTHKRRRDNTEHARAHYKTRQKNRVEQSTARETEAKRYWLRNQKTPMRTCTKQFRFWATGQDSFSLHKATLHTQLWLSITILFISYLILSRKSLFFQAIFFI